MKAILQAELLNEIHNVKTYKISYEEKEYICVLVGDTFNYDGEAIAEIPEQVIDFVEDWILGKF